MPLEFSPETLKKFEETVARYPKKEAAMLPVLYLAQQEFGHLGPEAIEYVAKLMGQAPARVSGVVSFYTMYNMKPIGGTIFRSAARCPAPWAAPRRLRHSSSKGSASRPDRRRRTADLP
jgi:hypothetical protein